MHANRHRRSGRRKSAVSYDSQAQYGSTFFTASVAHREPEAETNEDAIAYGVLRTLSGSAV
jgi:hypothetical protein